MYTFNVIYPDSLIDVWRYLQKQPAENCKKPLSEAEVVKAWSDFRLTIMPEAAEMSRKFGVSSVDDAASDFLTALFMGPCPSEIATAGTLKKRAKKYFAEKWNPCGKEVYDALAKAVRAMVRKGVLARSEPDKNIGPTTRFWIADVTPTHTAMPACTLMPLDPMTLKPYSRPPKPMVERTTDGLSSTRVSGTCFSSFFKTKNDTATSSALKAATPQNMMCQL